MITENRTEAERYLSFFLSQYIEDIPNFVEIPIERTGLAEQFKNYPLKLTHFEDLYDTLMYSSLIGRALEYSPDTRTIIDFGAGSSIPTLLAVKESHLSDINIIAIDIDDEAKSVGTHNAELLGLEDSYTFQHSEMSEILASDLIKQHSLMIVSNPPYIASPEDVKEREFVPVNGGEDGSRYIQDILNCDYQDGTTLALLWGSLTNPAKIIPLIESKFEVLHIEAMKVHFGKYTQNPLIKDHLYKMREQGKVAFDIEDGKETQIVIGTILRVKKTIH